MREFLAAAVLAAFLAGPSRAQFMNSDAPAMPQLINMSVIEALVATDHAELAGVFAFVPEGAAPLALADYLLRKPDALKGFVKKGEADLKTTQVINNWDKEVFLHLVAATAGGASVPGVKPVKKSLVDRISRLSLATGVPLEVLVQRRAGVPR
ncbi:MAG: hypothetical protein HYZ75_05300 [Elusimicrobia bacterium]|nr:hypothetical protein [Elusimicrobiota bacterium]